MEGRYGLCVFPAFVWFSRVSLCLCVFPIPHCVRDWLHLNIMALSGIRFLLTFVKDLELFFSPILSLLFLVWAHRHEVKQVYHVILTFPYSWLNLYRSDPLEPMSVCWYSRLSLSRIPRDSLKYFEISVPRHIRFEEWRKK